MRDLRLLLPAATGWAVAWIAVLGPDIGVPAWLPAAVSWVGAFAAASLLLVLARRARIAARVGDTRAQRRPAGMPLGVVATAVVVLAVAGVVATAAAAGIALRATSPLAAAAAEFRVVSLVVDLTGAPSTVQAPWSVDDSAASQRVEGVVVVVEGRAVPPVAVIATIDAPREDLQLGTRLTFEGRASALPSSERAAYRLRPDGEVTVGSSAGVARLGRRAAHDLRCGRDTARRRRGRARARARHRRHERGRRRTRRRDEGEFAEPPDGGVRCELRDRDRRRVRCGSPRSGRLAVVRVVAALVALAGFVVLVTPEASVVRAGAMAVVVLVAIAVGRPGGGVAALSLAVIGLLVVDPWLARDYGFALSAARRRGCCCWPVRSPPRSPRDAHAARGRARRAARRAARLPARAGAARPGARALRRAGEPARGAGGPARHGGRAHRLPPAAGPAVGRGSRSCRSRGCRRAGSRSSRTPRRRSRRPPALAAGCPGRAPARELHRARALAVALDARRRPRRRVAASHRAHASRSAFPSESRRRAGRGRRRHATELVGCRRLRRRAGRRGARAVRRRARRSSTPDPIRPRSSAASRCSASSASTCSCSRTGTPTTSAGSTAVVGRRRHRPARAARRRAVEPGARSARRAAGRRPSRCRRAIAGRLGRCRWRVLWPRPRASRPATMRASSSTSTHPSTAAVFLGDLGEEAQARLLASADTRDRSIS